MYIPTDFKSLSSLLWSNLTPAPSHGPRRVMSGTGTLPKQEDVGVYGGHKQSAGSCLFSGRPWSRPPEKDNHHRRSLPRKGVRQQGSAVRRFAGGAFLPTPRRNGSRQAAFHQKSHRRPVGSLALASAYHGGTTLADGSFA